MADKRFISRLRKAGILRIFLGYDFISAAVITTLVCFVEFDILDGFDAGTFISGSTSLAISLTGFIIAGVAILVSLTSKSFLLFLKKEDVYENLLFVFEYTVLLAISVSLAGIILQSYQFGNTEFFIFLFLFLYLLLATARLISNIITFGEKKADKELTDELADLVSQLEKEKENQQE